MTTSPGNGPWWLIGRSWPQVLLTAFLMLGIFGTLLLRDFPGGDPRPLSRVLFLGASIVLPAVVVASVVNLVVLLQVGRGRRTPPSRWGQLLEPVDPRRARRLTALGVVGLVAVLTGAGLANLHDAWFLLWIAGFAVVFLALRWLRKLPGRPLTQAAVVS